MLARGYDPKLATASICASGTLGPRSSRPSYRPHFMGDMLSGINSQVQMAKGNYAPTPVSWSAISLPALLLPGLLLVSLYLGSVFVQKPQPIQEILPATQFPADENQLCCARSFVALVPPLGLILARIRLYSGPAIATPTEGRFGRGLFGAMGGGKKNSPSGAPALRWRLVLCVPQETHGRERQTITSMVFVILLGRRFPLSCFSA